MPPETGPPEGETDKKETDARAEEETKGDKRGSKEDEPQTRDQFQAGFTRYFKIVPANVMLGDPAIFMQLSRAAVKNN